MTDNNSSQDTSAEVSAEVTADQAVAPAPAQGAPDAPADAPAGQAAPDAPADATAESTEQAAPETPADASAGPAEQATPDAPADATAEPTGQAAADAPAAATAEPTEQAAPEAPADAPAEQATTDTTDTPDTATAEPAEQDAPAAATAAVPAATAAPAAAPAVPAAPLPAPPPVPIASNHPEKWGRVDADGTVYVRTADGERAVGSWQAGGPDEGLAHYARRFDDVRTEVELLEARLTAGSGDPKHSLTSAKHIKEGLTGAALVGDLVALTARIDHVLARAQHAVESVKHARDEARAQAVSRKQELVAEVEQIAEHSTQWKVAGDRLRGILDEWKTIKGVDRKTDDQLWKRFSKARDTFNRRRGSHFADLDRQRASAKDRKQQLVKLAEEISDSDDWGPTAARYKELMTEWKAAGRAPKDADDALWQRFRAAQDKFFSRRSAVFDERDAELVDNAKRKEALLAEAEKINPAADLDAARAQLHRIQERWDATGKVPRERIRELEGKLRAVEEKVRNAADAQWRRTDPEAEARAAQFRERVEEFEAKAAKARSAGDKKRAEQAEAQAAQWREWLAAAENAVASR